MCIWAGSKEFYSKVIENLRLIFKISKENTAAFKYIGINFRTTKNTVFIDQKGYTQFPYCQSQLLLNVSKIKVNI